MTGSAAEIDMLLPLMSDDIAIDNSKPRNNRIICLLLCCNWRNKVRRHADAYDRPHKGMSMIAIRVLISTGISNKVTRMSMRVIPAVGPCGMQRPITGVLMSGILDTFQQAFFSGMLVFSPLSPKMPTQIFLYRYISFYFT